MLTLFLKVNFNVYDCQDEVCNAGKDILTLGLLFGSLEGDEASVDEQPEWLSYPHKLFQDFVAGFYVSKTKVNIIFIPIKTSNNVCLTCIISNIL